MLVYPNLKLKYEFVITEIAGECLAVPVGESADRFHGVVTLENESAKFLFEKLSSEEGMCLPVLAKECMDKFRDSAEEVVPKVVKFLDELKEKQLLTVNPAKGLKVDEKRTPRAPEAE